MADISIEEAIHRAKSLINEGEFMAALSILNPMLEQKIPEAHFLYSTFGIRSLETVEQFEDRSINILTELSRSTYPPAMYALACCYENGDRVDRDSERASALYKSAADLGFPNAIFRHGLNVYYGSNGIIKDESHGLNLIRKASSLGVEEAAEFLTAVRRNDVEQGL
jgi:TPR repeat protein